MSNKRFSRNIEDFICQTCSTEVKGNGYTNHCPKCFYSKHVDINPGDREAECLGLMQPISYRTHGKKGIIITHKCKKCGVFKNNKLAESDDIQLLINIIKSH